MGWKVCASVLSGAELTLHHGIRNPKPIIDPSGAIYAHLAGRPSGESYSRVIEAADKAMGDVVRDIKVRAGQRQGRRGNYFAINAGVSSGNGNSVSVSAIQVLLARV